MASNWNFHAFARGFVGNLRSGSDIVPVRVNTRLRILTKETAREVRKYGGSAEKGAPTYILTGGGGPAPHTGLRAFGQHYFPW